MRLFRFKRASQQTNIISGEAVNEQKIKISRVRAALYVAVFAIIGSVVIAIFAAPPSKSGCTSVCVISPAAGSTHSANFEIKTTATPPTGTASYNQVVTLDANTDREQIVDIRVQQTATSGTQTYVFKGGPGSTPNLFDYKLLAPGKHTITAELFSGTVPTEGTPLGTFTANFTVNKINNLVTNEEVGKTLYAPKLPYTGDAQPRSIATIDEQHRGILSKLLETIEPTAEAAGWLNHTDVVIEPVILNSYSGDIKKDPAVGDAYVEVGNGGQLAYPGQYPTNENPLGYACTGGTQPITLDIRDQGSVTRSDGVYKNSIIYVRSRTATDGKLTLTQCAVNHLWPELGVGTFAVGGGSSSTADLIRVTPAAGTLGKFLDPYNNSGTQRFKFEYEIRDSDGDGIPEGNDKCPGQAGPSGTEGCPSIAFDPLNGPLIGLTDVTADKATVDIFAAGLDSSGNPKGVLKNITVKVDGKVTDNQDLGAGPNPVTITNRTVNLGNIADGKMHDVLISAYNNNGETISKLRFYINPNSGPAPTSPTAQTSSVPEESPANEATAYTAAAKKKTRDIIVSTKIRSDESKGYKLQTLKPIAKMTVTAKNVGAKPQCNDLESTAATGATAGKTASYKFLRCPLNSHKPPYYPKLYQLTAEVPAGHHVNKQFAKDYSVTTQTVGGKVVAVRNYTLKRKPPYPAYVTFVFDKTTTTNPSTGPAPAPTAVSNPAPTAIPDQPGIGTFTSVGVTETLNKTNNERVAAGLVPLKLYNPNSPDNTGRDTAFRLTTASRAHALDMATNGFFSHISSPDPDSSPPHCKTFTERAKNAGVSQTETPPAYTTLAENLGKGSEGGAAFYASMHDAWMKSPPHRANIMNPDFRYMTVASLENFTGYANREFPKDPSGVEQCGPFIEPAPAATQGNTSIIVVTFWAEPSDN